MASKGLGSLTIQLIMGLGGFTGPMNKAERDLKGSTARMNRQASAFSQSVGKSLRAAAGHFLAFAAATVGIGAAFRGIKGAIDRADEIRDFSIQLGLSTEAVSSLSYAAKQTGTDMEALARGLQLFSKAAANALNPKSKQAKIFEVLLGKDYKQELGNLETLLPKVMDGFNKLGDSTAKTGAKALLFGRGFAELTEFMKLGSAGLDDMRSRAEKLGIVLSKETTDAADEFKDRLADLKAATGGLATQIAAELLPDLIKLVNWFSNFITEGEGARKIVAALKAGFYTLGVVTNALSNFFSGLFEIIGAGTAKAQALYDVLRGIQTLDFSRVQAGLAGVAEANARLKAVYDKNIFDEKAPKAPPAILAGVTVNPTAKTLAAAKELAKAEAALQRAFAGGGSGASKKTGKSDAEKEAERLEESYKSLTASLLQQIEFTKELTEVEKLRYELTHGEMAALEEGKKQELLTLTARLEAAEADKKLTEEGKDLIESLLTPTEELNVLRAEANKLLQAGKIAQEDYNKAVEAYKDPGQQLIDDLKFELDLLKMTNAERATAIQLRGLDAEQVRMYGDAIRQLNIDFEKMSEQTQFMEGVKAGLSDMFVDFVSGAKSAKEAFGDFADSLFAAALKFVTDKAINAMFKAFEGAGTGSATTGTGGTGWWASLLALFGGGKAGGGYVQPGTFYKVNERGTEMLSVGGSDYLMMGQNAGHVTPAHSVGAMNQVNNFNFVGRVERRTHDQVEATIALRSRRAVMRNA